MNGRRVECLDRGVGSTHQHRDLGAAEDDARRAAGDQAKLELAELFDQLLDDRFIS